jgi:hypothetical protein
MYGNVYGDSSPLGIGCFISSLYVKRKNYTNGNLGRLLKILMCKTHLKGEKCVPF